jgi:integrase
VTKHKLMGGKLYVYKRGDGRFWQCSAFLNGRNWRESTRKESLAQAESFAEDWYFDLRGKFSVGDLKTPGKTFAFVAEQFLKEYTVITQGQRSPRVVKNHEEKLNTHLLPYFGTMAISEITPGKVQDYRVHRATEGSKAKHQPKDKPPKPVSLKTIAEDIVTLRQVLKTAYRHEWLKHVPDLSLPYKLSGKVGHRAWFSGKEYRQLYMATRRLAQDPHKKKWKWSFEQMHDYVLLMANTGLRPDEANLLEYRDISITQDRDTGESILEIEVRGKCGVGHCKSTPQAVRPFIRMRQRNNPQPSDHLFPVNHSKLFDKILATEKLKFDREGKRRTSYSLRHTYICFRLMEGADIYQIAKNCRTSVEMIEKHYAVHLKNTLDASLINVRRDRAWSKERDPALKMKRRSLSLTKGSD